MGDTELNASTGKQRQENQKFKVIHTPVSLKLAWALRPCLNRDEECKVEDEEDAVGLIVGHWGLTRP